MDFLLMQDKSEVDMNHIIIDTDDILKRLSKLNVFKSTGPDMLHPRVLKEVRNEIATALKLIFDCSLASNELPETGDQVTLYQFIGKVVSVCQTIIDQYA